MQIQQQNASKEHIVMVKFYFRKGDFSSNDEPRENCPRRIESDILDAANQPWQLRNSAGSSTLAI